MDVRDNVGNWCVAQVVNIDGEILRVHFEGWNSTFDEDIRMRSSKVIDGCRSVGCGVVKYSAGLGT